MGDLAPSIVTVPASYLTTRLYVLAVLLSGVALATLNGFPGGSVSSVRIPHVKRDGVGGGVPIGAGAAG